MLTGVAFLFLSLLPAHAAGQLASAEAKCSPGFEWLFNSQNQSPCDLAVSLGGVCVAGQFNISQLGPGNAYLGPTADDSNNCRCSSVYYSLLCACAFCQQHSYVRWSVYSANCSSVYVASFPQPTPLGVRVPTWAYQNVSSMDIFDINTANSTNKSEGAPATSASGTYTSSSSSQTSSTSSNNIGAIAGAVGGLVGLALIGGLVAFCLIWNRKRSSKIPMESKPFSTNLNHTPEVSRPTIPGFSAPSTPFMTSGALDSNLHRVPYNASTLLQAGYPASVTVPSEIYESSPMPLPITGNRLYMPQKFSSGIPATPDRYYDPQSSLSTVPVTTDNYWDQTSSSSISPSRVATDTYYDSPVSSSAAALQYTGDSRSDPRSLTSYGQHRQSSLVSSPATNQGSGAESRGRILPPSYADVVDGSSRRAPLPEKQELT